MNRSPAPSTTAGVYTIDIADNRNRSVGSKVGDYGKETRVMSDADPDEIADRLARESKARVQESRRLIEASKRARKC
jgi:hypothetical protein